jgi:hypothetical protein
VVGQDLNFGALYQVAKLYLFTRISNFILPLIKVNLQTQMSYILNTPELKNHLVLCFLGVEFCLSSSLSLLFQLPKINLLYLFNIVWCSYCFGSFFPILQKLAFLTCFENKQLHFPATFPRTVLIRCH